MLATHDCQLYVGAEDDRLIASIMVGHEGHRGWLYKLAVLPEFHGKGLGRDLVQQAERWLVARGVPKVNLMIRDTNIKVREFYQRLGYEVAARTVMERWLNKPDAVDMDAADLDVVTTYMEMTERPTRPTVPCPPGQYAVLRLERPSVTFYRYLYSQVGERWMWSDRRKMSDEALDAAINAEGIEIYVLYASGEPAGYVELDRRAKPDIRIAYFGLAPFFIGRGLGRASVELPPVQGSTRRPWRRPQGRCRGAAPPATTRCRLARRCGSRAQPFVVRRFLRVRLAGEEEPVRLADEPLVVHVASAEPLRELVHGEELARARAAARGGAREPSTGEHVGSSARRSSPASPLVSSASGPQRRRRATSPRPGGERIVVTPESVAHAALEFGLVKRCEPVEEAGVDAQQLRLVARRHLATISMRLDAACASASVPVEHRPARARGAGSPRRGRRRTRGSQASPADAGPPPGSRAGTRARVEQLVRSLRRPPTSQLVEERARRGAHRASAAPDRDCGTSGAASTSRNTSSVRRTATSLSNSRSNRARPAAPEPRAAVRRRRRDRAAPRAGASASSGSTSSPVSPSATTSGIPPARQLTTGSREHHRLDVDQAERLVARRRAEDVAARASRRSSSRVVDLALEHDPAPQLRLAREPRVDALGLRARSPRSAYGLSAPAIRNRAAGRSRSSPMPASSSVSMPLRGSSRPTNRISTMPSSRGARAVGCVARSTIPCQTTVAGTLGRRRACSRAPSRGWRARRAAGARRGPAPRPRACTCHAVCGLAATAGCVAAIVRIGVLHVSTVGQRGSSAQSSGSAIQTLPATRSSDSVRSTSVDRPPDRRAGARGCRGAGARRAPVRSRSPSG